MYVGLVFLLFGDALPNADQSNKISNQHSGWL